MIYPEMSSLVEQTGHGVPFIVSNYGKQAFEIMDNYINVTIPFSKSIKQEIIIPDSLNKSQEKVFVILKDHPEFTIKDIVHMTSFSDGYVRKILTELKLLKMVERIGSKKTGYWKVKTL